MSYQELVTWLLGIIASALGALLLHLLKNLSDVKELSARNEETAKNLAEHVEKNEDIVSKIEAKCEDHVALLNSHDMSIKNQKKDILDLKESEKELKHTMTNIIREMQEDRKHNDETHKKGYEEISKKLNTVLYRLTNKES